MLGPTISSRERYANAAAGFHVHFMERLERQGDDPLMQLATVVQSRGAVDEHLFLGDMPGFEEWTRDRTHSVLQAYRFTIRNRDWSSGVRIHRNEIEDDRLGSIRPRIDGLAERAAKHRGDLLVKHLINGFAGNLYNGEAGDGLSFDGSLFFATNHTMAEGVAQSNKLTAALSRDSLVAAEAQLRGLTTWDGRDPLDMSGTHLIVGPKLEATARELVGSQILINPAGTAAGSNPFLYGRYQVLVSPRLSGAYDDYWFLADLSKANKPLIFQDREPITTAKQVTWDAPDMYYRGEMKFGAQARYGVGLYDWRTIVGSQVA